MKNKGDIAFWILVLAAAVWVYMNFFYNAKYGPASMHNGPAIQSTPWINFN